MKSIPANVAKAQQEAILVYDSLLSAVHNNRRPTAIDCHALDDALEHLRKASSAARNGNSRDKSPIFPKVLNQIRPGKTGNPGAKRFRTELMQDISAAERLLLLHLSHLGAATTLQIFRMSFLTASRYGTEAEQGDPFFLRFFLSSRDMEWQKCELGKVIEHAARRLCEHELLTAWQREDGTGGIVYSLAPYTAAGMRRQTVAEDTSLWEHRYNRNQIQDTQNGEVIARWAKNAQLLMDCLCSLSSRIEINEQNILQQVCRSGEHFAVNMPTANGTIPFRIAAEDQVDEIDDSADLLIMTDDTSTAKEKYSQRRGRTILCDKHCFCDLNDSTLQTHPTEAHIMGTVLVSLIWSGAATEDSIVQLVRELIPDAADDVILRQTVRRHLQKLTEIDSYINAYETSDGNRIYWADAPNPDADYSSPSPFCAPGNPTPQELMRISQETVDLLSLAAALHKLAGKRLGSVCELFGRAPSGFYARCLLSNGRPFRVQFKDSEPTSAPAGGVILVGGNERDAPEAAEENVLLYADNNLRAWNSRDRRWISAEYHADYVSQNGNVQLKPVDPFMKMLVEMSRTKMEAMLSNPDVERDEHLLSADLQSKPALANETAADGQESCANSCRLLQVGRLGTARPASFIEAMSIQGQDRHAASRHLLPLIGLYGAATHGQLDIALSLLMKLFGRHVTLTSKTFDEARNDIAVSKNSPIAECLETLRDNEWISAWRLSGDTAFALAPYTASGMKQKRVANWRGWGFPFLHYRIRHPECGAEVIRDVNELDLILKLAYAVCRRRGSDSAKQLLEQARWNGEHYELTGFSADVFGDQGVKKKFTVVTPSEVPALPAEQSIIVVTPELETYDDTQDVLGTCERSGHTMICDGKTLWNTETEIPRIAGPDIVHFYMNVLQFLLLRFGACTYAAMVETVAIDLFQIEKKRLGEDEQESVARDRSVAIASVIAQQCLREMQVNGVNASPEQEIAYRLPTEILKSSDKTHRYFADSPVPSPERMRILADEALASIKAVTALNALLEVSLRIPSWLKLIEWDQKAFRLTWIVDNTGNPCYMRLPSTPCEFQRPGVVLYAGWPSLESAPKGIPDAILFCNGQLFDWTEGGWTPVDCARERLIRVIVPEENDGESSDTTLQETVNEAN